MFRSWFYPIHLTVVTLLKLKIDCVNNFQIYMYKELQISICIKVFKIIVQASHNVFNKTTTCKIVHGI